MSTNFGEWKNKWRANIWEEKEGRETAQSPLGIMVGSEELRAEDTGALGSRTKAPGCQQGDCLQPLLKELAMSLISSIIHS